MKKAPVLDRRAKLLDEVADYILSNGLADLSLRPLATAINTSPRMLLYFFGSKERLIAEALAHIRAREQIDFKRAVSKPRATDRLESLVRDWRSSASPRREKYSRLFFEVYGLALQNPEEFPEFLERAVGDWLPLFEQAFAAAGVSPAHAQTLATLALGAVRGLHLDLLATGERKRTEAAFREMLRLFSLVVQSRPKLSGPKHSKDGSARPASSSQRGATRNTR
jgi:AcrR family transcriptional regulator